MLLLSTWIPRSYTHLREAFSKLDQLDLKLQNIEFEENLTFEIKNAYKSIDVEFIMTPIGIYSVTADFPKDTDEEKLRGALEDLILEKLIKTWHSVTYKQIKNGVIPLKYSCFYFNNGKGKETTDGLTRHFSEKFSLKSLTTFHSAQFASILTAAIDDYILKMSEFYHKADGIITSLKREFELSELKKTVFEMDYIEKITGEIMARIKDSVDCLEREKKLLEKIDNKSGLVDDLDLEDKFRQVETDLGYTQRLWEQLDVMLDNLDNASNARLSYQETVESRRVEWFLSVEAASVIATLLLSIFVSEFTGVNAILLTVLFMFTWALIFYVMKKIRAK